MKKIGMRLMKKYSIAENLCPNLTKAQQMGFVRFVWWKAQLMIHVLANPICGWQLLEMDRRIKWELAAGQWNHISASWYDELLILFPTIKATRVHTDGFDLSSHILPPDGCSSGRPPYWSPAVLARWLASDCWPLVTALVGAHLSLTWWD